MTIPINLETVLGPSVMRSFKLIGYGLVLALLISTHTAVYMKGRADVEEEYAAATVEQLQQDLTENAERIERQVSTISEATQRFGRTASRVEDAIDANQEVNTNPNCNLSADEFSMFNESIGETDRSVSGKSAGTLLGIEATGGAKSGRTKEED